MVLSCCQRRNMILHSHFQLLNKEVQHIPATFITVLAFSPLTRNTTFL